MKKFIPFLFFWLTVSVFADDTLIIELQRKVDTITYHKNEYQTVPNLRDNGKTVIEALNYYIEMNVDLLDALYALSMYAEDGEWLPQERVKEASIIVDSTEEPLVDYSSEIAIATTIDSSYKNWKSVSDSVLKTKEGLSRYKIFATNESHGLKWFVKRENERTLSVLNKDKILENGTYNLIAFYPYKNGIIINRYSVDGNWTQIELYEFENKLDYWLAVGELYPNAPPRKYMLPEDYNKSIFKGIISWENP
jgi:hypothetical protein